MTHAELLKDKDKDPQSVFVCTWHPKLKRLPSILNENHKILNSDTKLNIIFSSKSTVAFRRKKHLANYLDHGIHLLGLRRLLEDKYVTLRYFA